MRRFSADPIQSATTGGFGDSVVDEDSALTEQIGDTVRQACAELQREARQCARNEYRWLAVLAAGVAVMLAGVFLR